MMRAFTVVYMCWTVSFPTRCFFPLDTPLTRSLEGSIYWAFWLYDETALAGIETDFLLVAMTTRISSFGREVRLAPFLSLPLLVDLHQCT